MGQERLLRTPVTVVGDGPAFDVARGTLSAGGTPIEPRAALVLAGPETPADVLMSRTLVAAGCRRCLADLAQGAQAPGVERAVLLGSLAALAIQRLVLGRASPVSLTRCVGAGLEMTRPKCPHSP